MTGNPFTGESGWCPLLRFHEEEFHCGDRRHPYYLSGCNVWPTHPGHIVDKPSCSYKFVRVDGS